MHKAWPVRLAQTSPSYDHLAAYHWGCGTLVLPPDNPLAKALYTRTLASISDRWLSVDSDADFRDFVALIHELAHCLQDFTTGLGMSDLLARVQLMPRVLEMGRDASWGEAWQSSLADLGEEYRRRSFVNTLGQGPDREVSVLQDKLAGIVTGDVSSLSVVSLLEAEAVLSTRESIRALGGGAVQRDIVHRNHALFDPGSTPHAATFSAIETVLLPKETPTAEDEKVLEVLLGLVGPILLDLSLAVPPPAFIAERGLDPDDFHPGVRFARMLSAYHRGAHQAPSREILADRQRLYSFVESQFRITPQMDYPPVSEIYEAWALTFHRLAGEAGHIAWTARWMASLAERRVRRDYPVWARSAAIIQELEIPFQIRAGTEKDVLQLFGSAFRDEGKAVHLESQRRRVHEALMHFMLGMQPAFACPRALRSGGCAAQTESCFAGITRLSELPSSKDCVARRELEQANWRLTQPTMKGSPPWL